MPQGLNGCYGTRFVAEFVAKRAKNQKLPKRMLWSHNKKSRARTSITEAKARDFLFKNQTIPGKSGHKKQPPTARSLSAVCGAPNRIRTCGLLIRSQTLYPAELWVRVVRSERKLL